MVKIITTVMLLYNSNINISDYRKNIGDKIIYVNMESKNRKKIINCSAYNINLENKAILLIHKCYIDDSNETIKTELEIFKDNIMDILNIINGTLD